MASSKNKGAKARPQKMKKSDVALVEAIIDKMQELVDYYPKVRAFYEGKRRMDFDLLLSRRMRLDYEKLEAFGKAMDSGDYETADALHDSGFTDNCLVGCLEPLKGDAGFFKRIDSRLYERFAAAYLPFVRMLRKAFGKDKEVFAHASELIGEWSVADSQRTAGFRYRNLFWNVVEAGMVLSWRELKIYCAHHEWVKFVEAREHTDLKAECANVARFINEFWGICHVLSRLALHLRQNEWKDLPGAFVVPMDGVGRGAYSCEWSVRLCLSATVVFDWRKDGAGLHDCPDWIGDHVSDCISLLHDYFVRRAAKCPKDARALWIEVDADLVAFIYGGGEQSNVDADRIIELANRAAKAEWVARRMANGYDDVKIEFPRSGERQAQSVRLDEGQLAALVAARADGRRDTNRIIGEVRKAAAGSDGGCHHRDKAKDKVVQAVIRHLAKPGVVFSIHDACEKVGGRRNASWLYSWCHDHEDEIHAQVDILRNAESAFLS